MQLVDRVDAATTKAPRVSGRPGAARRFSPPDDDGSLSETAVARHRD